MDKIHAHYCLKCDGYSPCYGYGADVPCLLTDSCVQCGMVLDGAPSVLVGRVGA
jgi:hypothetical protein